MHTCIGHNFLFWFIIDFKLTKLYEDMTKGPWSQHSIYELIEYIYAFIYQQRAGLRWIMVMMSMSYLC